MTNTTWRRLAPNHARAEAPAWTEDKNDLFSVARLCARALELPASWRLLLDQLCAVYGGQGIDGRILVWPSNEHLEQRTGLPERTIRHAIGKMVELGVLRTKDSPNLKRFAIRDRARKVVDAYGFDLTPMLNRASEFRDTLIAREEQARERGLMHDAITIARRRAQDALGMLASLGHERECADYGNALSALLSRTPRRRSKACVRSVMEEWQRFAAAVEASYLAASDGKGCRHIEADPYPQESSAQAAKSDEALSVAEVLDACPDMVGLMGEMRDTRDLVRQADRWRGHLGISPSAWDETVRALGPLQAACLLTYVGQLQTRPERGIRNAGGYFRTLARKIAAGEEALASGIGRLKRGLTRGAPLLPS